jgi:hypothetical protein
MYRKFAIPNQSFRPIEKPIVHTALLTEANRYLSDLQTDSHMAAPLTYPGIGRSAGVSVR